MENPPRIGPIRTGPPYHTVDILGLRALFGPIIEADPKGARIKDKVEAFLAGVGATRTTEVIQSPPPASLAIEK
jgi:hypothetical protein